MDFISRILGRPDSDSAQLAKQRLQMVLIQDRTNISPETLNLLKDEIITAISKHIEIDQLHVEVSITENNMGHQLIANIPVRDERGARNSKRTAARKAT